MNKAVALAGLGILLIIAGRVMTRPKLNYFSSTEFGIWWPLMSSSLLTKLDQLRSEWGYPIYISPVEGGIGREGEGDTSQHNITMWGEVRAVDIFPTVISGGFQRPLTEAELAKFYQLAESLGFGGVGVYTDTHFKGQRWPMFHVDVREKQSDRVATWSRVDGEYLAIDEVIG